MKRFLAVILSLCLLVPGMSFLFVLNIEGSGPDPHWGPTDINTKVCDARWNQESAVVVPSDDGGVFISWLDRRNDHDWDVYIQKMDRFGNAVFQENGMPVCTAPGNQTGLQMISDDSGGVFLVWEDQRDLIPDHYIYGQRIEWDGTVSWGENGTAITNAPYPSTQSDPNIVTDGTGGFLISWVNTTFVDDIFPYYVREILVQRFLSSGDRYWLDDVKIMEEQDHVIRPDMVSDGEGGAIILWEDNFGPRTTDIFSQRVNGNGIIEWASSVSVCAESRDQDDIRSIPDGQGGVITAWRDDRAGTREDIYASRLNSTGEEQWKPGGIPICTENAEQYSPEIFMNEDDEIFMVWTDYRIGASARIFMQKLDMNGTIHFEENGTEVGDPDMDKWVPKTVLADDGFFYIFWFQGTVGRFDIHGQLFQSNGSKIWDGHSKVLSNAPRNQILRDACQGALGSAFIVWYDDRYHDFEIDLYMTRVGSSITTRSPVKEVWEDDTYFFDLDPAMEDVTWSLPIGPDWLTIDPVTGELSGTPLNGDVGTSNVWVEIEDGTGSNDILAFQVIVKNRPPTIITDGPFPSAREESEYNFTFESDDDGQGTITWTLLEGPDWLSMNATTGMISGIPENNDVGNEFIRVSVDDGNGGVAELSHFMKIEDDNDPPSLLNEALPNGTRREPYWFLLSAIDIDRKIEVLTFSMETNATWLRIDGSIGGLSGTPDAHGEFWVNITVSDICKFTDWKNLSLTIHPNKGLPPFDQETDSDGDGMPDWWEYGNYLDLHVKDSQEDVDADGFTNLQEFNHGTDPMDRNSHPPFPDDDDDDDDVVPTQKDLELTFIIVACVIFLGLVIFGILYLAGSSRKRRSDRLNMEE